MTRRTPSDIDASAIVELIANFYHRTTAELLGKRRHTGVTHPRHLAFYFIRRHTNLTTMEIGAMFNRDHTTVTNGVQRVNRFVQVDPEFKKIHDMACPRHHYLGKIKPPSTERAEELAANLLCHA